MMKKLLLLLILVLVPCAAFAQADRDILLTSSGTLYTIEGEWASMHPEVTTSSERYLVLTRRDGDTITRTLVPGSVTPGVHSNPALAFDPTSKILFIFWKHTTAPRESNLVFSSVTPEGQWSNPEPFASVSNVWRSNLRIGITRKTFLKDGEENEYTFPEINLHVVWWEDRGGTEELARYSMLTVFDGAVSYGRPYDLDEFVAIKGEPASGSDYNHEILRHPAIFESQSHDTIDVVFGDTEKNGFHRVTIRPFQPYVESRVRIPLGVKSDNFGAPHSRIEATSQIGAIGGAGNKLVLYYQDQASVKYLSYRGVEGWTDLRTIPIDATGTSDAAVEALRRMIGAE